MKDMLSEALAEIGRLLNQLVANLTGEDETKRNEWMTEFKKFLRKETCWATSTTQVATDSLATAIRTMIIDHTKGLITLIADCGNGWVNEDITEKRFPITDEDGGEWEYDVWDPKGSISSSDAVKQMAGDDESNPWLPARIAHLLVFGKLNPDAQRSNPIVALGSVADVNGDRCVPYLNEGSSERNLNLRWWSHDWGSDYRFLRVRKLVKKS